MIDIRGDFKPVHKGVIVRVDFLGSERFISYGLLAFCILGNLFLMWSLWQIVIILITILGFIIGRVLFKSDPTLVEVFIDNLRYEDPRNRYILSSSNINNIDKIIVSVKI